MLFLCGTLSFSGCFHNNPVRKAGVEYYQMRHWRLGKVFVISPPPTPPPPPQCLWHKVMEPEFSFRISDSKSRVICIWFLVFLLALYFTLKGVEAILKVTSFWLIIKHCFFFIAVTQNLRSITAVPKKTLLLSLALPICLGDWSV